MKTQTYIREHGLQRLLDAFHIIAKRHPKYANLVFLKYTQIDSPMAEAIVQECRGLILDEADDWRVISCPFNKFFNYGEGHAPAIDWTTASVFEKLDGSLMTLYWYDGAWQVASNGTPDAGGKVQGHGGTFADLFWETWKKCGLELPDPPDERSRKGCYMFELTTPFNRVVVPHAESRLTCLGARYTDTLQELDMFVLGGVFDWPLVRRFPLQSLGDVVATSTALNPMEGEGFVVCDANFNRVKVKSPQYVALAHMKEAFSARRMLEVIRANESDEFLTYFPEMKPLYSTVRDAYDELVGHLEGHYAAIEHLTEQKAFALEAMKCRFSSALFSLRNNRAASVRAFLAEATLRSVERALGLERIAVVAEKTGEL